MTDIKALVALANMVFYFYIPAGSTTGEAMTYVGYTAHLTVTFNPPLFAEAPRRPVISGTMSVLEALCGVLRQTDAAFIPADGDPTTISVIPRQLAADPKFVCAGSKRERSTEKFQIPSGIPIRIALAAAAENYAFAVSWPNSLKDGVRVQRQIVGEMTLPDAVCAIVKGTHFRVGVWSFPRDTFGFLIRPSDAAEWPKHYVPYHCIGDDPEENKMPPSLPAECVCAYSVYDSRVSFAPWCWREGQLYYRPDLCPAH